MPTAGAAALVLVPANGPAHHLGEVDVALGAGNRRLDAMGEHRRRHALNISEGGPVAVLVGGEGLGALAGDDVGAVAVDLELNAERGDADKDVAVDLDVGEAADGPCDAGRLSSLLGVVARREGLGVLLKILAPLDDLDAPGDVTDAGNVDAEAETVEQLRAQVALLGVHGADQDRSEERRVG